MDDHDALIAAWERVLGKRSEGEARDWIEGMKAREQKYRSTLWQICRNGRCPIAEEALGI